MRKNYSFLLIIFFTTCFLACSDDDKNQEEVIPTSDFVLNSPFYWNLPLDKETVYIVKSDTEMRKYIDKDDVTEIIPNAPDFDKSTLLLSRIVTPRGISKIETKFIKYNKTDDTLEIHITLDETMVAENRVVAITVPTLGDGVKVTKRYMFYAPM